MTTHDQSARLRKDFRRLTGELAAAEPKVAVLRQEQFRPGSNLQSSLNHVDALREDIEVRLKSVIWRLGHFLVGLLRDPYYGSGLTLEHENFESRQ